MSNDELFFRQHIFCCTNERPPDSPRGSCKARGAEPLRNYLKARVKELGIEGVRVSADRIEWKVPVPANGTADLTASFDTRY